MYTLFLDTSLNICFGVLDENLNWVGSIVEIKGTKASELHFLILEDIKKKNISLKDFSRIITSAGPGSYTGMRVGENFNKIFSLANFKSYSFYEYDIPSMLKINSGLFIAKAYKGQVFFYSWNILENKNKIELVNVDDKEKMCSVVEPYKVFFSNSDDQNIIEEFNLSKYVSKVVSTIDLIKENSRSVFNEIIKANLKRELYYYRPLEEEFTTSGPR